MGAFTLGSVRVDLDQHLVDRDGSHERLTTIEADCLRYLVEAGRTVSRDELHANVWRYSDAAVSRACDTTIRRLRTKIEDDPSRPEVVITVHGLGYRVASGRSDTAATPIEPAASSSRRYPLGDRVLDLDRLTIEHDGSAIAITGREAELLEVLIAARGASVERDSLSRKVWGGTSGRPLEHAVSRIRRKLEADPRSPQVLVTTALGYRLDLPDPAPTGDSEELGPTSLPAEPDRRFGRNVEIEAITAGLAAGDRLFTLTGPPGVGKTRLALAVAHHLQAAGQCVAWVEGSEAQTNGALCAAIARALRLPLLGSDTAAALARALDGDRVLVIDNLEQLPRAGEVVETLLAGAPGLAVLVTSRALLRIRGERAVTVPPLSRADAAALFVDRAPRPPREDEHDEVLALVDEVERLPLAIELAAARTRVLSTAQIRAQTGAGLRLLSDGPDGRSIRASLESSWTIAPAWARSALCQLTVFEGRFTHDAAEAVLDLADAGSAAPGWTIDVLQELCDTSLLRYDSDLRRFSLLRVVREYAAERLSDRTGAEVRHGRWFAATLDRTGAGDELHGPRRFEILALLALELPDLQAAIDRAVERSDPDTAIAASLAAWEVWAVRGPYAVAVQTADRVCRLSLSPSQRARAELVAGSGRIALGESARAEQHLLDARALAQVGAPDVELAAYRGLARLYVGGARHAEARQAIEEGRVLARRAGSWSTECSLLMRLALFESDLEVARGLLLDAERIAKTHDAHGILQSIVRRLGEVAVRQGRVEEAEQRFSRARRLSSGSDDLVEAACLDSNQASLFRLIGRSEEAVACAQAAARGFRRIGDRAAEAKALTNLGAALVDLGRWDDAEVALLQALEGARFMGQRTDECTALHALGMLAGQRTDRNDPLTHALAWFREAMVLSVEVGETNKEIVSRMNLGKVCCLHGETAEGLALLYGALDLCEQHGDSRWTGNVLATLAASLADVDRLEEASVRLADAVGIARKLRDGALIRWTRCLSVGLSARLGQVEAAEGALAQMTDDPMDGTLAQAEVWVARAEVAHARGNRRIRDDALARAGTLAPAQTLGARYRTLASMAG